MSHLKGSQASPACACGGMTPTMSAQNLSDLSRDEVAKFVHSFDTVLTDCDGVLWLYNQVIAGSPNVLNRLRELGKQVFYITNNSTKTREEFTAKCHLLGFIATQEDIVSTSYLTACYLQDLGFNKTVYVVGTTGITKELDLVGIKHTEVGPDPLLNNLELLVKNELQFEKDIGAVVVGFDPHISFPKILKAASYLSDKNCLFIGTNSDERFPMQHESLPNLIVPGTGSLLKSIETCAQRKPFMIGKPALYICDAIMKRYNINPKRTLMIGDRCNTDILLGKRCGFQTLLVLTGVTSLQEVEEWKQSKEQEDQDLVPDYYLNRLGDLLGSLNAME